MLNTILISSFVLLALLVGVKVAHALLGPRPYLRNDDDPFKVGSTAWSRYGQGSETWREHHGEH